MGYCKFTHLKDSDERRPICELYMENSTKKEYCQVIVTGCDRGIWEGTGAVVDKVLIPMGDDQSIEKGSIYRVKYFTDSDGTNTAYELDSVPVPNTDIQLLPGDLNKNVSILRICFTFCFQLFIFTLVFHLMFSSQIWCTSRILSRGEKYWTVRNEILGEAKFPLTRVSSNMKIGDEVRTMYGRVLIKGGVAKFGILLYLISLTCR